MFRCSYKTEFEEVDLSDPEDEKLYDNFETVCINLYNLLLAFCLIVCMFVLLIVLIMPLINTYIVIQYYSFHWLLKHIASMYVKL